MNPSPQNSTVDLNFLVMLTVVGLVTLAIFFFLAALSRIHLRMGREASLGFSAVVSGAALASGFYTDAHRHWADPLAAFLGVGGALLSVVVAVPLAVKIYGAWLGLNVTPEEATPGPVGFRAWLSPLKLTLVLLLALSAQAAYGVPFWAVLAVALLLLLAYPVGNAFTEGASSSPQPLGAERERVLSLLESGRITAEESAELLNALAATAPADRPARGQRLSVAERRALLGGVAVFIGFLLPWYVVDPAKEMQNLMGQLNGALQQMGGPVLPNGVALPQLRHPDGVVMPGPFNGLITVRGGDMPHGLGWIALACALAAAFFPLLGTDLEPATRRLLPLLLLGVGGIVILYLITSGFRWVGPGLILAAVGYLIELTALLWRGRAGESLSAGAVPGRA